MHVNDLDSSVDYKYLAGLVAELLKSQREVARNMFEMLSRRFPTVTDFDTSNSSTIRRSILLEWKIEVDEKKLH
jgi:hypothetical protein